MIQSQLIGEWRIFLVRIFERHIYEALFCGETHKIKLNVQFEFPKDLGVELVDSIQNKAVQNFDRKNYDNQLGIVLCLLGKPVDKSHMNLKFIKKHKVIRDVIQHNRGELRESGFDYLGLREFSLSNGPVTGEKIYKVGDTVTMTYWEIDQLYKNLFATAKILIRDSART